MQTKSRLGPLLTLAAVVVLGAGIWGFNVLQEPDSAAPAAQSTTSATSTTAGTTTPSTTATTTAPSEPAPPAFPANASYVGKITTPSGVITLEVTIAGDRAIAYACDGNTVEVWLRGSATDGVLVLQSKDGNSTLDGRLDGAEGAALVGTLTLGSEGSDSHDFTAAPVDPPAGLYVYDADGVRTSWIVDTDGTVTGVQRRADGSTGPAPELSADGSAVVDGATVTATKVEGEGDVN